VKVDDGYYQVVLVVIERNEKILDKFSGKQREHLVGEPKKVQHPWLWLWLWLWLKEF
jgi:hypothetical protein